MTLSRNTYYIFGGTVNGLMDPNIKKIGPSNELWNLEILAKQQYQWNKISCKGDIPSPRSNHVAILFKKNDAPDSSALIFIHGGMNESGKLEDCFFLDAAEGKFTKLNFANQGPMPRANHSVIAHNNKIYIFGGNGGRFYENSVFKDLWCLDVEKLTWHDIKNERKKIF